MIYLIFILLAFGVLLEVSGYKHKNFSFVLLLVLLVIIEGSKWESGVDFFNSFYHYEDILIPHKLSNYEILYDAIVYFFASLKISYTVFLFVYFAGVYALYYFAIRKLTEFHITTLFFIFAITIGLMGSNRQILALALGFYATAYFLPARKTLFAVLIVCAALVHQSALFFLPFLFLTKEWSLRIWGGLFVFAFLMLFTGWPKEIFDYIVFTFGPNIALKRAKFYNQLTPTNFSIAAFLFGISRRLVPIVFMVLFKDALKSNKHYTLVFNILCLSLFIYIMMNHDLEYVLARIAVYYIIFEAVLYSWLISQVKSLRIKILMSSIYILFLGFLIYKNTGIYPELFFPFNTIFGRF